MKPIKLLTASLLTAITLNVNAELISIDLNHTNDGLITRDTVSGLDWLDLTSTLGQSVNETNNNQGGWISKGFRYANEAEVIRLFLNSAPNAFINYSPFNGPYPNYIEPNSENRDAVYALQQLLGITYHLHQHNDSDIVGFGLYLNFDDEYITNPVRGGTYTANDEDTIFALFINDGQFNQDYSYSGAGSFLVRTSPVPIPAAVWLFSTGLLGLFALFGYKRNA